MSILPSVSHHPYTSCSTGSTTEGSKGSIVDISKQSAASRATRREGSSQSKRRETKRLFTPASTSESEKRTVSEERFSTSTTRSANVAGGSEDTDFKVVNREQNPLNQDNRQAKPLESPRATRGATTTVFQLIMHLILAGKRRRGDEPNRATKRLRRQSLSGAPTEQVNSIKRWLEESCPSPTPSIAETIQLLEAADNMPPKHNVALLSPDNSFERTTTSSRKSERTAASVRDTDYRQSLRHRNVYINREEPFPELVRRAKSLISRQRTSLEMDDEAIQQLIKISRQVEDEGEEVIVWQLASRLIPAMKMVPDRRLASNVDQPWANSVPVPLKPSILTKPLPLPKPIPDLAFGYSQNAFTENQLRTIELLIDD